ncbi:MAG: hypothetical protein JW814_01405 [Candidatus Krumholzibacteriota bacterium]|nr:hypothetical protein [Candidatus Krumholzibacteriota bacterium]
MRKLPANRIIKRIIIAGKLFHGETEPLSRAKKRKNGIPKAGEEIVVAMSILKRV